MRDTPDRQGRFLDREYWDSIHGEGKARVAPLYVRAAKKILGPRAAGMMGSYEDHLLMEVIYPAFLPAGKGTSVLEIGSAPGGHLVWMHRHLGLDVWGIEYSREGADANREHFARNGIDPGQVIEADLFDDGITGKIGNRFDIVLSRGFIEHFDDPGDAIERHLRLLRPGGTLVVSIPNMRGANYIQALLFNRGQIPLHNREIMRRKSFESLFDRERLEHLFCGYYGTFKAHLFIQRRGPLSRLALRLAEAVQAVLNLFFRLLLRDRGLETPAFSPNLLFIGRKKH
jgi:SAM-dependent methyltransferase